MNKEAKGTVGHQGLRWPTTIWMIVFHLGAVAERLHVHFLRGADVGQRVVRDDLEPVDHHRRVAVVAVDAVAVEPRAAAQAERAGILAGGVGQARRHLHQVGHRAQAHAANVG